MVKTLFWLLLALILGLGAAFLYVDQKVSTQLARAGQSRLSAIYSDVTNIGPTSGLSSLQVREKLLHSRYSEVRAPSAPGEFSFQGDKLTLITREFAAPDGSVQPSRRLEIARPGAPDSQPFSLEPQIVAAIGGGEMRASDVRRLQDFPERLQQAVLAVEDERFYEHHGIDVQGILRAIAENIRAMRIVQGGSTVTQQLAKNLFFSPERSLNRKAMEALSALSLEYRLSKEKILEMYLNEVYLGQEGSIAIHGFSEAAKTFFGKRVEDLTLDQSAMLAGIIKAPSYYSPRWHKQRALERRDIVLGKMRELRMIGDRELQTALKAKTDVIEESLHQRRAPHFVVALQQQLGQAFNLEAAGLQGISVYTGLDLAMQQCGEDAVKQGLEDAEKTYPKLRDKDMPLEAGLVSIEPFSGKIRAWVGGRDYNKNQFDHVLQAKRQIGSTVKPFLYLTALDGTLNSYKVATPMSILSDRPMAIDLPTHSSWEPENYDRSFKGDVTLRYALENSLNLPAVYTAQRFGFDTLARTLMKFHIAEQLQPLPALALGASDTTLLDLTGGFAALANSGNHVSVRLYLSALESSGSPLASNPPAEEPLADENAVYVLTDILEGVVERGTARAIRRMGYEGPVAGKTGTSNDTRDAWFVGFTPDLATGVWVGYDDNRKIGLTGGVLAAPIWAGYMKCVSAFKSPKNFIMPRGVVVEDVDVDTGELASPGCPQDSVIKEIFVAGTEPRRTCHLHGGDALEEPPRPQELPQAPPRRRSGGRSFWDRVFDW